VAARRFRCNGTGNPPGIAQMSEIVVLPQLIANSLGARRNRPGLVKDGAAFIQAAFSCFLARQRAPP